MTIQQLSTSIGHSVDVLQIAINMTVQKMNPMKIQEATDKIAQYEIDMNKGKEQSVLYTAEIEELKSKIAFSKDVEIPKVPTAPKKKPEEMTALEKAKAK